MIDPMIAFVLIGCIVAIAYGVAVLPRKLREFRDAVGPNPARQAAVVAQARAELAASGWTADDATYQCVRAQQGVALRALQVVAHD